MTPLTVFSLEPGGRYYSLGGEPLKAFLDGTGLSETVLARRTPRSCAAGPVVDVPSNMSIVEPQPAARNKASVWWLVTVRTSSSPLAVGLAYSMSPISRRMSSAMLKGFTFWKDDPSAFLIFTKLP